MAGWAIPMGEQVSVEARLQRHRDARDAVMGRRCYCPDDCRCRREDNPPCGCREHELRKHGADAVGALEVLRSVAPITSCPRWVIGDPCCGDPGDCNEPCNERTT